MERMTNLYRVQRFEYMVDEFLTAGCEGFLGLQNFENKCLVEVDSENMLRMHEHL